jgi:phage FluMu gp28-like protein
VSIRPKHIGKAKVIPARDTLLLPYQAKWVKDESRLKLMEKSRQIGMTWATAYRLVSTTSLRTAKFDDWVSSRDDLQARLLIQDCKNFAELLSIAADDLGERVVDKEKNSAYVLRYANGHQTHSLSSNPDAQAGKRGRRILDEFALHPDPRKLWSIAYPGITWGGSMELISTHRGSANFFNELVQEIKHRGNPKKISLHTVRLDDALADGFLYKLQCKLPPEDARQAMDEGDYFNFIKAGCADPESFEQEFRCNPADDATAFLSYDLIASCEYPLNERWERTIEELAALPHDLFMGVDIGRKNDLTVFWIIARESDVRFTRHIVTLRNTPYSEQRAMLYDLLSLPNMRRAAMDDTGIGNQLAEEAHQKFQWKVEPYTFTLQSKADIAYPLRFAFEGRNIRIPNTPLIRSHLRAIRKEQTTGDKVKFSADSSPEGHADMFWALALAIHASKPVGTTFYAEVI